jgi:hypothetical protein
MIYHLFAVTDLGMTMSGKLWLEVGYRGKKKSKKKGKSRGNEADH